MNTPVPAAAHRTAQRSSDAVVTDILEAPRYHDDGDADLSLRETLANLGATVAGRVVTPSDPGWDEARAAWNLAVDQRPAAVVVAASIADIAHTVRVAKRLGLAVAAQGTGHNAGPLAAGNGLADAILLRTHELRGVEVDVERRIARVEPGAQWGDVVAAVAPHGLTALAGSSHDVGVVGYTLGGGVSWLARTYGVAANHVVAIELVTVDGVRRRVDDVHEPELFWALRGGGGDFGVVTALEFRLFDIPEIVAGTMFWPIERAEEVLGAWAAWTAGVPDSVTSVGRLLRFPPLPDLPPFLSGRSFVVVEAAMLESPERVDELLAPLRALGPEIDTVHPQPTSELLQLHMDPPGPTPGYGDGMLLTELPPAAVRAFLAAVGPDVPTALLSAEIRHIGAGLRPEAAVTRAESTGSALPGVTAGFDAEYLVYGVGIAMPGAEDGLAASLGRLLSRIEPWRAPLDYLNFAEHELAAERMFGDRLERLRAVKHAVDPTGVMRSNHPVAR
ncbi:FAD-binding oxidoreductase [Agromyces sp. SYSU K20354]|uniref:FAD-binding oxidoreductase n=1 Tax=Agromyces cavernae TaxID=2898659 RepID=UPI001E5F1326|nr:FAD-binding oxidoreductase [Agromyces cavernae]MCD2441376.1 FAD-binding oxidoreductase [Agromyces cavernae]